MKKLFFFLTIAFAGLFLASCESDEENIIPSFEIQDTKDVLKIEYGESVELHVNAVNVASCTISAPKGWKAEYAVGRLAITAPFKEMEDFDKEGVVTIFVTSESGNTATVLINVVAGEWVVETELRVLTFEDEDYKGGEGENYWSSFIPNGQYGRGHGTYSWDDDCNTELMFEPVIGMFGAYGGHAGISNYVGEDWENEGDYMHDLQAYMVEGAHSGVNFNTYFGYLDDSGMGMMDKLPPFTFGDGVARVIDHMWVTNTTYVYNQLQKAGFGSTYVLSDESTFKIIAYGYESDDDDEPTTAEFYLLNKGKKFVTEWTKWDLSLLGKVVKVEFNIVGSDDMYGDYGLSVPGYFAYDDVAVQFESETGNKVFK